MRITFRGRQSLADVRKSMIEALDHMESIGATHTTGTNFYFNLCDEAGKKLCLLASDGEECDLVEFAAPERTKPASPRPGPHPEPEAKPSGLSANVVPFPRRG